jgi:hypothetical protein
MWVAVLNRRQIAPAEAVRDVVHDREDAVLFPQAAELRQLLVSPGARCESPDAGSVTQDGERRTVIAEDLPRDPIAHDPEGVEDGI